MLFIVVSSDYTFDHGLNSITICDSSEYLVMTVRAWLLIEVLLSLKCGYIYRFGVGNTAFPTQPAAVTKGLINHRFAHIQRERAVDRATPYAGTTFRTTVGQAGVFVNRRSG